MSYTRLTAPIHQQRIPVSLSKDPLSVYCFCGGAQYTSESQKGTPYPDPYAQLKYMYIIGMGRS